jgi:hypothetical protein
VCHSLKKRGMYQFFPFFERYLQLDFTVVFTFLQWTTVLISVRGQQANGPTMGDECILFTRRATTAG